MVLKEKYNYVNLLWRATGTLAISLACISSVAANAQVSNTVRSDGAKVSSTAPKASTVVPDAHPAIEEPLAAGATVIYSNFGTKNSLYDASSGWTEAGLEANDYPLAEAMSFTPDSNYVLVRIDGAFTYVTGTNGMKLVLAEDNNGVPGKIIYVASFSNLPTFGTCCTVQTAKLTPTATSYVPLLGGKTYWLYPLPADTTAYVVWNYDTTGKGGIGAVSEDYGKTWASTTYAAFGAFDLYGVKVGQ